MKTPTKAEKLQQEGWQLIKEIVEFINCQTEKTPLILYQKGEDLDSDNPIGFYDLPYGFFIDKHGLCIEGSIVKIHGADVALLKKGENFMEPFSLNIQELPYESLLAILNYFKT